MIEDIILYPLVSNNLPQMPKNQVLVAILFFAEALIGIIVALGAKIYFSILNTVGHIVSMQSGLGSATFFDPSQNTQTAVFANMLTFFATVALFITDTHHLLIQSVIDSYIKFPPGEFLEISEASKLITHLVNDSFILSFKIASPFIIISLLILVGGGILSRLMPNFQVFFVMTPAQILVMFSIVCIMVNIIIDKVIEQVRNSLF
jgi:flagellar biosynthetic protein FliR